MNKKVTFVLSNLAQGGSERQMVNLSEALALEGYKIDVITYYREDFYDLSSNLSGVNYVCLDCKNKFDRIRKIRKYYINKRPQIVITLVDRPAVYALISAVGIDMKFILTWRNSNCAIFGSLTGKIINFFSNKIYSIVCNSHNSMNLWMKNRPQDSKKLCVIYNLIKKSEKNDNFVEIGVSDKRVITIAARVVPDKNAENLIHAVSVLNQELKSKLIIKWYGNPDDSRQYYEKVISFRDEKNLKDTIYFEAPVKNICEIMSSSDAVALFSHREGFPNAICEGLQIGKPIILTPVSDYNILLDGNGFLCASDRAEDISNAIERFLCASSEELEEMGKASKQIFDKNLNFKTIIQEWIQIIENMERRNG